MNRPRPGFGCLFEAALPIAAPLAALGIMLSLLAFS